MAQDPRSLLQKAEKAFTSAKSGWWLFGGRIEKYEDSADLFTQAANTFLYHNQHREAAMSFERAASIQQVQLNDEFQAANTLVEAFKAYKAEAPEDAIRVMKQAIDLLSLNGRYRMAAQHEATLAMLCENVLKDPIRAAEIHRSAAKKFEKDNAPLTANKHWVKSAEIEASQGHYPTALEKFERVAKYNTIDNKYSAWGHFFSAGICRLAIADTVATTRALKEYVELLPSFETQQDYRLLVDLNEAYQYSDSNSFAEKLRRYEEVKPIDKWKSTALRYVKEVMEGDVVGEETGERFN